MVYRDFNEVLVNPTGNHAQKEKKHNFSLFLRLTLKDSILTNLDVVIKTKNLYSLC